MTETEALRRIRELAQSHPIWIVGDVSWGLGATATLVEDVEHALRNAERCAAAGPTWNVWGPTLEGDQMLGMTVRIDRGIIDLDALWLEDDHG